MSSLRLLCLPGDGIGPEIAGATLRVLAAAAPRLGRSLEVETAEIGFAALAAAGTTIPEAVLARARAADGVILGPVSHNDYPPVAEGGRNPSGVLRRELALFANIRPARTYPGLASPTGRRFDLVIARENLEGFYADRNMAAGGGEFMPEPGIALAMRKITEAGSRRIAEAAFRLAAGRQARRVTAIHKANVMRLSDGLFLEVVREVAARHPEIACEELLVDAAAAHLVREPERFDVLLCTNMFGDILSDLAAELAGGLGLAGSLNHGETNAVAQAQHGSAPGIAGQDRANPVSLILSAAMLLRHLGEAPAAAAIEASVARALAAPESRTGDLGGPLGTAGFTDLLCQLIPEAPQ
ncbi:isocitrate/isopropylmalate dehydrogenase family protein [Paralimibaculum aggregatum]|uniref:Isocitrate/isopropylmalate dehydrogenase family protein n=1 Tax=Paralimibaculum aggregatum TaxID=3036245 RepID=A0ABQ6LH26_9RHOB|nr:isocitrate/isopropylmalate dehydrogenase family protein [Limibaculum sp. NKW23]GMG81530.1 isocitrate/isopropylmalate dehydrogenase family protein [Limibaculum sp. NKW23]